MTDQSAREAALDIRRSILLQAPAGSGKTTVLAQRFLRALAAVDAPEEVLAITFTRKAAAEMRERVLLALEDALPAGQPDLATWRALQRAVQQRAAQCGWQPAELPQRLRIQTIDSLAHEIARAMPVLGRMQGNLGVVDDAAAMYADAARETLRYAEEDPAVQADVDRLLRRLDNNWDQACALLAALLPGRNRWQPLLLQHAPGTLAERVEASLHRIIAASLQRRQQLLPAAWQAEAALIAAAAARQRRDAGHDRLEPWAAWLADDARLAADPDCLGCWQAVAALVLKEDGERRAQVNVTHGFSREDRALKERWRRWKDEIGQGGTLALLREIKVLPQPTLHADEQQDLAALARVMLLAAMQLKLVFRERGLVDHAEISAIARQALRAGAEQGEAAVRQSLTVSHLLVDEFQDTSPDQMELVAALVAGWNRGDTRSLFVVGDPMQSIYLFRDSEVGLFLRTRATGVAHLRLAALHLSRNFRSAPVLVDWANRAFGAVFPALENLRTSAVTFLPADAARSAAAGVPADVRVWPQPSDDGAVEAAMIAAEVRQLRAQSPACTIAVLVQTRALAAPVLEALQAAAIPATGVDLAALADRTVVRDLVALGQALLDAADRTAWLAVLRSPPCGLLLADLLRLSEGAGPAPLVDVLDAEAVRCTLSADGAARLRRVAPVLLRFWRHRGSADLASTVEQCWRELGGEAACRSRNELAAGRQYLMALRQLQEQSGRPEPAQLAALARRLRDRSEAPGRHPVEVLTIHHAKGLEWDAVFVPGLGRTPRSDTPPLLRWLELPAPAGDSDLLLAVRSIGEPNSTDPLARYIAGLQEERQQNERLRLLYVAATRARQRLYLSGHAPPHGPEAVPRPASRSLLRLLWPAVQQHFAAVATDDGAGAAPAAPQLQMDWHRLPAGFARTPATVPVPQVLVRAQRESSAALEFSWVGPLARAAGTVMHAELERLARLGTAAVPGLSDRIAGCAARLREHGIEPQEATRTAGTIVRRLQALVQDERARWLLLTAQREAASELRLSGIVDGELRDAVIDRSFVDAQGSRWVIDYKTGVHGGGGLEEFVARELERYGPQLRLYSALAAGLGSEPVRAALYFPWLGEFRELPRPAT